MEVERYRKHNGAIAYWLKGVYTVDSEAVSVEPRELMSLLTWLQEHENEIIQDSLSNSVNHEMKGL